MLKQITLSSVLIISCSLLPCFAQTQCSGADVCTWHYDNYRTGWQQNETALTKSNVSFSTFGKIMQYNVQGAVYAQPLALHNVSGMTGCSGSCDVMFVVTQQDMLYAFNADFASAQYPPSLWSLDLAAQAGGTYANCYSQMISPCVQGVIYPDLGVTSTPVIDRSTNTLYVVSFVYFPAPENTVQYYIHAINYLTGKEIPSSNNPYEIVDHYPGPLPIEYEECGTFPTNGNINFDPSLHYQRTALLLLDGEVYVAFAPSGSELANGWIMAYSFGKNGFQLDDTFVTTPYGTGGGVWMDGAGIATDGNYLYTSVANGTFDAAGVQRPSVDYGDSLLKMNPYQNGVSTLSVKDFFTPSDVFTFVGGSGNGTGRCPNDEDLGSGGVMLFPDVFYSGESLMLTADKESKLYVVNTSDLTGYNSGGDQIVEEFQTPYPPETLQGYWGSPAYWEWTNGGTNRAIYYSVDATTEDKKGNNTPQPMNMYMLQSTAPPVSQTPIPTSSTAFCGHGAQPSVSSNTTGAYSGVYQTGIVWAYEDTNSQPNCQVNFFGRAALHAYDASNIHNQELYNSRSLTQSVSYPVKFATPVVFNGNVYIGTQANATDGIHEQTEVDVFGLCGQNGQPSCFTN